MNDLKIKRNAGIFSIIFIVLILIISLLDLRDDYLIYQATANSAPFYIFAIKRIISIVIGIIAIITMSISIKKDNKNRKEE